MDYDFNDAPKKFRVVKATDLGIAGTGLDAIMTNKVCLLCGNYADREVWIYKGTDERELNNQLINQIPACSETCAEMIAMRQ